MTSLDLNLSHAVDEAVAERTGDLVELVRRLVRFDTTSVDLEPGSAHTVNAEAEVQEIIAGRLAGLGASVDSFEPDPATLLDHPMMPAWHHWRGRPMTVGRLAGHRGGRSLIINGHIDVVAPGDPELWTDPPFSGVLRDGRIYGRGACDMKGGLAAALVALEVISELGVRLDGEVIFEAVTDEETCAMGTVACIERGYRADAGFVPEPTEMNLWTATRGLLHGSVRVRGRSAHAEVRQPPWTEGGGVNAIREATPLLVALGELERAWSTRGDKQHPLLSPPEAQPTRISGGSFVSNVPESCTITLNATYLPSERDGDGYGSEPRSEIEATLTEVAARDPWLVAHPLAFSWSTDYPPSEMPLDHPIILAARGVGERLGQSVRPIGIDTTFDGALLTTMADTVCPAIGPGSLTRAHAPDEWIGVQELAQAARFYAHLILDWCGVA